MVVVRDGRFAEIRVGADAPAPPDLPLTDLTGLVLGPGLVDSHVHINDPGRAHWEGFASATRAAAAGGVTTLVDMPLNSLPPTTTLAGLRAKQAAAAGVLWVDVALWGGITGNDVSHVDALVDAGVAGFKVFLSDSGVAEFPPVDTAGLGQALKAAGRRQLPVVIHAEAPGPLARATPPSGPAYAGWLASRPAAAELEAVRAVVDAAAISGGQAHIVHLSAAGALPLLESARRAGVPVSAETCPHYLSLSAEELPDGTTVAKCAPPIREASNREELWDGVRAGIVTSVVSDHSPAPPKLKNPSDGDFAFAWGGISGLQTQLPVVWSAARERGVGLAELAQLQCTAPAALAGLSRKGSIVTGMDADLVAWDPSATWVVDPSLLLHRHPLSPWAGRTLHGVVRHTWLRGRLVDVTGPPFGTLLARSAW